MFGEQTSTMLMAAGVALAAFVLLRASWRRRTAAPIAPVSVPSHSSGPTPTEAPPELSRWQVEMHETARDLKAELDSKLSALQALVALARHERILLEASLARAAGEGVEIPTSTLGAIESLGDPAAVENPHRLAEVAAQLSWPAHEVSADLFARDRESLQVDSAGGSRAFVGVYR